MKKTSKKSVKIFSSKKGMEMWLIVGMILALVLLALLIYIAYSKITGSADAAESLTSCEARNGETSKDRDTTCSGLNVQLYSTDHKEKRWCCIELGGSEEKSDDKDTKK
ncbi:hypothetical protein ACFL0W_05125 [Nanoarchaeota archaeon]